ncbi:MAG: ribosomal protein L7/L12 [Duncaniella sp.]|nr:ribosomal protein L7/L12 [Duncaniella sp.]
MGDREVIIYDQGPNKLSVVRVIKSYLNVDIAEAKAICDSLKQSPRTFKMYGAEAKDFTAELQKLGAKVENRAVGSGASTASPVKEEMDRIKELQERIEALEARIARLENSTSSPVTASAGQPKLTGKVVMGDHPVYFEAPGWRTSIFNRPTVVLSDGRRGFISSISTSEGNYTVGQTRKVAAMFGYKYDSKTKREALGWELVSKYGDGKWAFIGTKAVNDDGVTYDFYETDNLYSPNALAFASNKKKDFNNRSFVDLYQGEPFRVLPDWNEQQIHDNLVKFIKSLVRK